MDRKSLDELEIMTPKKLGYLLLAELQVSGFPNIEYMEQLINAGASLTVRDDDDWTALHYCSREIYNYVVELLISAGADLNARSVSDTTPLHFAACNNNDEVLKTLIAAGASLDVQNYNGETPLHWGAKNTYVESVKSLLEAGASKGAEDRNGRTPWDIASAYIRTHIPELNPSYNG